MPTPSRAIRAAVVGALLAASQFRPLAAQTVVPLSPDAWSATDTLHFLPHLGRPSLYFKKGVALIRDVAMENGTLELDLAATDTTNFLGVVFRAATPTFSNVVFLRPALSGNEEALQYGPAFNTLGVAWQVYHYDGANAVAILPRNAWIHLKVELDGQLARVFVDTATTPTLVVPRIVASGGTGIGLWTGPFGHGAWFSNIRYTPATRTTADFPAPAPPAGTILHWELSSAVEAKDFSPTRLPSLARLTWQKVDVEPEGFVLVNRYREAPVGSMPRDSSGAVLVDSVMTGRVVGERIVYARTTLTSPRAETRRLEFSYNNGIVIYLNGRPLFFAMNPGGLRTPLGTMAHVGDGIYLPLRAGRNELVYAVMDLTGGWAFSGRMDPR
jgi:hypothetical protein